MIPSIIARLVRSGLAHVYPAYRSYRALERGQTEQVGAWTTYWVVLGLFSTAECVSDAFFWWLPLYEECKILAVLWLVFPDGQGSQFLYRSYVQPLMLRNQGMLESRARTLWDRLQSVLVQINLFLQRQAVMPAQPVPTVVSDFEEISSSNTSEATKRK